MIVLLGGLGVNMVVEQKLRNDVQASDQALAQEIALETSLHLRVAEQSLEALGKLALQDQYARDDDEVFSMPSMMLEATLIKSPGLIR